ncbi:unnamed protein product [Jaminaea pallidilutea]
MDDDKSEKAAVAQENQDDANSQEKEPSSTSSVNGTEGPAASTTEPSTTTATTNSEVETPGSSDDITTLKAQLADLNAQVKGLNGKLVTSFMRISDLEDDLSDARERAMTGTTKVAELEKERQEHLAALNTGLLVEKAHVSTEMTRMMDRVIEETKQRGQAESDKAKIEAELDELSASLFNEANRMVAVEKLARARAEEKSKSMEERLQDTEGIMLEQQKVLADLQRRLDESNKSSKSGVGAGERVTDSEGDASGGQSLREQQYADGSGDDAVLRPGLMLDTVPYQELCAFLDHLRKLRKQLAPFYSYPYEPNRPGLHHRQASSGYGPSTASAASSLPGSPMLQSSSTFGGSNSHLPLSGGGGASQSYSQTSPFVLAGLSRHKDYPLLPSNCEQLVHLPSQLSLPFVKRCQEEDSEPCLRLDFAPGLNWLTRRQANTAIVEGNLVIEPVFPGGVVPDEEAVRRQYASLPPAGCSMCGMPVVNVPMPGGEEAGKTVSGHGTPDLRSMTTWASSMAGSAAVSLREAAGVNAAPSSSSNANVAGTTASPKMSAETTESNKPPLKSSRSGLFSSLSALRAKAGSPRLASDSSTAEQDQSSSSSSGIGNISNSQSLASANNSSSTAAAQLTTAQAIAASLGPLPVPTHIFRLSETATGRYLLCPHHCLIRLRAACAFWGYLRNIERAVVLEGKLAWDDEVAGAAATKATEAKPETSTESQSSKATGEAATPTQEAANTMETLKEEEGKASEATASVEEREQPSSRSSNNGASSTTSDEGEDDAGFHDAVSASETNTGAAEGKQSEQQRSDPAPSGTEEPKEDTPKDSEGSDGSKKPAPIDVAAANAVAPTAVTEVDEAATAASSTVASPAASTTPGAPPAVPPRRARRTVPAAPSESNDGTTSTEMASAAQTARQATPTPQAAAATAAAAPKSRRRTLWLDGHSTTTSTHSAPSGGPSTGEEEGTATAATTEQKSDEDAPLIWEEKVWLEVNKLKRAMYEARTGVEHRLPVAR